MRNRKLTPLQIEVNGWMEMLPITKKWATNIALNDNPYNEECEITQNRFLGGEMNPYSVE